MPLCQAHHNEIHMKGNNWMVTKFPDVAEWLFAKGWLFDLFRKKWLPPSKEFAS